MQVWLRVITILVLIISLLFVGYGIITCAKEIDMILGTTSASNYLLILLIATGVLVPFLFAGWIKEDAYVEPWLSSSLIF
jgi:hypothetical protein